MELYPAIDVQGGRVARGRDTGDPVALGRAYARAGARWVHFVDLDRAYGRGDNRALARAFIAAVPLQVQVGGGLSGDADVAEMLAWGAARVVVGTAAAVADAALLGQLLERHGPERIALAIDVRAGRLAPRGTDRELDDPPVALARRALALGLRTVVYTDVTRDGQLAGPDLDGARAVVPAGLDVIVSGGVASLPDLAAARAAGVAGVVVGRALHEGRFTLADALACAQ
jgi:phosphoribosylformimino-5-aminoimidazole carboxamide ribonucleotide (ProFAR) isomerase